MKVLPVLDLLDGIVVRGVAGKRDEYRAVESCLVANADALAVARAFRDKLDLSELYVADLDAILHERPNTSIYRALADEGFDIMIDAGLRDLERATSVLDSGATAVIAGLETSPGPRHLRQLCADAGADRVIFSLDMQQGRPLGELSGWKSTVPFEIAVEAIESGIQQMIVLDLAQVGVASGLSTTTLCQRLIEGFPHVRITTGGGVRSVDDLIALQSLGVHGALVASALHNGSIDASDLQRLRSDTQRGE